jgi:hypothetical protein
MNDSTAVPAPPPQVFSPAPIPKKDQEDLNIEAYERVFAKCMDAAARLISSRHRDEPQPHSRDRQVKIAIAVFDRFYNDQASMKQGKQQADAMLQGLSQVLEGRR